MFLIHKLVQLLLSFKIIYNFFYKKIINYPQHAHNSSISKILLTILLLQITYFAIATTQEKSKKHHIPSTHTLFSKSNNSVLNTISVYNTKTALYRHEYITKKDDTILIVLAHLGIQDKLATAFIQSDALARTIIKLSPGKRIVIYLSKNGKLMQLHTILINKHNNQTSSLLISRQGNEFKTILHPIKLERHLEMRSAEIQSSLFSAIKQACIPNSIGTQIVNMFSQNINFISDLRHGDKLNVIYETFWSNGELIRTGRVLIGEFINAGRIYQAIWFNDPYNTASNGYYSFDGKQLKPTFLKSPLTFTRISSGFSMRKHPILGLWKKHSGIDFAAPKGTPVHAAGDGIIDFIGKHHGYGNIIIIKHWKNYTTAYGHMHRFATKIHKGTKVRQGEIIGYVGMTGWATGPHLHYEFRIGNVPLNPLKINVLYTTPLSKSQLQKFRIIATDMYHRLLLFKLTTSKIKHKT